MDMKMSYKFVLSVFILCFFISISLADDSHYDFFRCLDTNSHDEFISIDSVTYTPTNSSYQTIFYSTVLNLKPLSTYRLKPIAIITPLQESQIPPIIRCSKLYGIQIRTRSGGHDFEGISFTSESTFIVLDMRNLRSVKIDAEKKTGWAQAGATLGELYYAIANTSRTLAFPAGVCPTVCVGGHFSGGGFGMISRKFGLAIDHIIDARIVDVNGRVLDRESMGEDLFWAIRGGGGSSFGVILAWKINLVSIPETLTVFRITRSSENNVIDLIHKHQLIADKLDNKLVLRLFVEKYDTIEVIFKGVYLGRVDNLLGLLQENFLELGLIREECSEMSWIESILYIWSYPNNSTPEALLNRTKDHPSAYYKVKSDFLTEPIPKDGLSGLWKKISEETDDAYIELQITPYGGRINEISESELPFPHRLGTRYMIDYFIAWDKSDTDIAQKNMNWIRELYKYMELYASKNPRGAYLNYIDLDLSTDDEKNVSDFNASIWGVKYFKHNFEKLVQVKTKVDPMNFFRHEQSIPIFHQLNSKDIKEIIESNQTKLSV